MTPAQRAREMKRRLKKWPKKSQLAWGRGKALPKKTVPKKAVPKKAAAKKRIDAEKAEKQKIYQARYEAKRKGQVPPDLPGMEPLAT